MAENAVGGMVGIGSSKWHYRGTRPIAGTMVGTWHYNIGWYATTKISGDQHKT